MSCVIRVVLFSVEHAFVVRARRANLIVCAFVSLCAFCFVLQQMIVATDVAARGLDIPGVDMVFHYRLPKDNVRTVCCGSRILD